MGRLRFVAAVCAAFAIAGACAIGVNGTGDAGSDATAGDGGGGCPQFDLQTDPQHCGSCTKACATGELCSSGKCASSCQSPTTKCIVDGGALCITLSSDPNHCGQCTTQCSAGDAGGLEAGTNNPDSGIPPGYDAGIGWTLGSPSCDASACTIVCPPGTTSCNGVCFDTQNFHDHCGSCTTACQSTEWCNSGHCCAQGTEWCGSSCIDVLSDPSNCGKCGNVCGTGTPYCFQGVCTKGCTPTGTRQAFNTLSSHSTTGCWNTGNPCQLDTYNFSQTYGQNFQANNQQITCNGTTACIGHVGIDTYTSTTVCEGSWDVYCDTTKVGSINTVGKTCTGSAMTNGCSVTFTPTQCSSIQFVATGGSGTQNCCAGTAPDSMIVGVSAW